MLFSSSTDARIAVRFFFLMIRRPPRSTLDRSSAASDVYKRQLGVLGLDVLPRVVLQLLESQGDAFAVAVEVQDLDLDLVTDVDDLAGAVSYTHLTLPTSDLV